jgi:hypothetical protein
VKSLCGLAAVYGEPVPTGVIPEKPLDFYDPEIWEGSEPVMIHEPEDLLKPVPSVPRVLDKGTIS